MTGRLSGEHALPLALSFAAGFVEAICFTGLFHTFTTFITGTLMIMIIELVNGEAGYLNKAIIFVAFFAFTMLWIVLIKTWSWRPGLRKPAALLLEAALIAAFMVLGTVLEPLEAAGSVDTLIVSVAAVLAMSLHSTIFFVLLKNLAPTHFMTGNLTNFSVGVVDLLRGPEPSPDGNDDRLADAKFKVWHFPAVISSFVAGVALGSAGFLAAGFVVLIVPATVLATAAYLCFRIEARAAS